MISLNYISGTLNSDVETRNGLFDITINGFPVHIMYNDKAMDEPPKYFHQEANQIVFPDCSANFRIHQDRIQMFCTPNGSTKMSILLSEFHKFGFLPGAQKISFFNADGRAALEHNIRPETFTINRKKMTMTNLAISGILALSVSKLVDHPVRGSIKGVTHAFNPKSNLWTTEKNTQARKSA